MALARGILALPLSSILPHSSSFASSILPSSIVPRVTVVCTPSSGRVARDYRSERAALSTSGNECYSFRSKRFDNTQHRRDRGRGFLAMAVPASSDVPQTVPVEEDDEEYKIQETILAHQKGVVKLSRLEEARTVVNQIKSGILSTISKKHDGFPVGSMVAYCADEDGSILLSISSLSPHTSDLEHNPKCSLLVPKDPTDKTNTVVTIIGEARRVADQEEAGARTAFLKSQPGAFWVDFGDFRFVRIRPQKVRYVSGLATGLAAVAEFTGEEFQAANVDPISQFAAPIAGHMNRDHADQTAQIVENSVGVKVDSALIQDVDRFGFNVLAKRQGKPLRLRIPFPRPAEDRKAVKTLIIELLSARTTT